MASNRNGEVKRNWILIFFQHGSNAIIVLGIIGMLMTLHNRGTLWSHLGFVLLGLLIWVFAEYLSHRFMLHAQPFGPPALKRIQQRLHYRHHEEPDRLDLLFLPPWFLFPNVAIYAAAYFLLTGSADATIAIILGNFVGLLHYERVHYIAHIPVTPGTAWERYMKKYHLLHHYKNEHYWYGVTNPWTDRIFGTFQDPTQVDKSGTTRDLFGAQSR